MDDIEMEEMGCFKFIDSVQLIKDLPIILISSESKKNVIEEAMMEGACFFLKKPISSKNLKNVWQHVYRKTRKIGIKTSDDQEAESEGAKKGEIIELVGEENPNENDQDGLVGGTRLKNSRKRMPALSEKVGEIKRRKLDETQEFIQI